MKLFDLSEDVSDEVIADYLGKYGEVISIREQRYSDPYFPDISTGVRIIKMLVKKNIESFVIIDGEMTQVTYFGQRQTCRHCREFVHIGATCVQNKKLLVQKSYADTAKLSAATPTNTKAKPKAKSSVDTVKPSTSDTDQSRQLPPPPAQKQKNRLIPPPSEADFKYKQHYKHHETRCSPNVCTNVRA